jgi:hypothetical protein
LALFAVSFIQRFFQWLKIKSSYTVYSLQTLIDNSLFSSAKAMHDLGYRPRPLAEAVSDFLAWRQLQQKKLQQALKQKNVMAHKAKPAKTSGGC